MRIIKIIALTLVMMLSLNGVASAESALNRILSTGVLKAGTTGDFPPFSKRDVTTNEYEGFDIDVLRELAKDMDVEIEFVPTDWKTLVNGIVAGNYDISGSASIQAKRMKAAGYSDTYMACQSHILNHKKKKINKKETTMKVVLRANPSLTSGMF